MIPAAIRDKAGLKAGMEIDVEIDDFGIRLVPRIPGPELVRENGRWVVQPRVPQDQLPHVDVAALIDEVREQWPR